MSAFATDKVTDIISEWVYHLRLYLSCRLLTKAPYIRSENQLQFDVANSEYLNNKARRTSVSWDWQRHFYCLFSDWELSSA